MKKVIFSLVTVILLSVAAYLFYSSYQEDQQAMKMKEFLVLNHDSKQVNYEFRTYKTSMTLAAIGDLLIHSTVYNDAKTNDSYDFSPMFKDVKNSLMSADLTIANQETIIGGSEIGLSTYPSFNSPYELADTLKDTGIDIVSIANNHTLDRGERAILNATSYFDKIGMEYVGGYRSQEDKNRIRVMNRNGIDIAFLSFTYGTNGIPVPSGKEYLVNLIDIDAIKKDIADAKEVADVVAISMHWGNEYQRFPSDLQLEQAQEIADAGADLIIGHHPHVLQPMGWLNREDGGKTFVIYSLGNFLSGQMWDYKDIGGILQVEITREVTAKDQTKITIDNPSFISTFVTNTNQRNFRVVPLENAGAFGLDNAQTVYREINDHMFQWLSE